MLESVFKNVLEMSFSASFLIVAVLIARIILRKSSKLFRKVLWGLVAVRLVVPFSFESALSLLPNKSDYVPHSVGASAEIENVAINTGFDWKTILPYVWLVMFVVCSVYAIFSFIRLKYKMGDAVLLEDNVFQSEKVDSPFVFGIIKPRIYISYHIKDENLGYVLKHEKTHIKYFDHITKLIGFAILCIHWFNPLVWISYVLFCKDVELACDEVVVKDMTTENRKGYTLALCDIGMNKSKISVCPVAFGEISIKERVKSTLSYKKIGKMAITLSVALCATVAVCFMTTPESKAIDKQIPKEEVYIEKTSEPTTEIITEPVTESTTEPVTEEKISTTTNTFETSYENNTEEKDTFFSPEEIEILNQQRDAVFEKQRRLREQEMEEFERKQEMARLQNEYNKKNSKSVALPNSRFNSTLVPTIEFPQPSIPALYY